MILSSFNLILFSLAQRIRTRVWRLLEPLQEHTTLITATKDVIEQLHRAVNIIFFITLMSLSFSYFGVYERIGARLEVDIGSKPERILKNTLHTLHVFGLSCAIIYFMLKVLLKRNPVGGRDWMAAASDEGFRTRVRGWLRGDNLPQPATGSASALEFADTPFKIRQITEMNYDGFANSQFSMKKRRMYYRNSKIAKKNPMAFMLIYDPLRFNSEPLGFTCVLPLNEAATRAYVEGGISDKRIHPAYITAPGELPSSLVIFSICLKRRYAKVRSDATANYVHYILSLVALHLRSLYPMPTNGVFVPVYAQAEKGGMKKILLNYGFIPTGHRTADGCDLLKLDPAQYFV